MFFKFIRMSAGTSKNRGAFCILPQIEQGSKNRLTLKFLIETNYLREAAKFVQHLMKKLGGGGDPEMESRVKKIMIRVQFVFHFSPPFIKNSLLGNIHL